MILHENINKKKKVRGKYKKEGGKRKRSRDKIISRIPVMIRLSCVANTIADAMRSGHRPTPAQALRLASAAGPQS